MSSQSIESDRWELVRVDREVAERLLADDSEPAVLVSLQRQDDGTCEMMFKRTDVIAENQRLRRAISEALELNRQAWSEDEDNDSPGNMQHAILVYALERPVASGQTQSGEAQ